MKANQKPKRKPTGHGGARTGAGRKATGKKSYLIRLDPGLWAAVETVARATGKTRSFVIETALQEITRIPRNK